MPVLHVHQHGVHERNRHEAVGGERCEEVEAEERRPVRRGERIPREKHREDGAEGGRNEDDAELSVQTVHPGFNEQNDHREEEHHGDGIAEPEMHGFGLKHFSLNGVSMKNEAEKHRPAQKARRLRVSAFLHRGNDADAAQKVEKRGKSGGNEEN